MTFKHGVLLANAFWLILLGSCAATPTIKTWTIGLTDLTENDTGAVLTFLQAMGYRCYSEPDDEFWRNQLAVAEECCTRGN